MCPSTNVPTSSAPMITTRLNPDSSLSSLGRSWVDGTTAATSVIPPPRSSRHLGHSATSPRPASPAHWLVLRAAGLSVRVGHGVDDRGDGQHQDVVLTREHLDPVGVPDPEPALGDLGDLVVVALDRVLVVDDVAVGVQVGAVLQLGHPPLAERRDHGLVDHGDPFPVRPLDLHAVPDVQHPLLDLGQLVPVHVLEQDRLADPQRLAVEPEHALAAVVLDHVVVADGDHALAHLIARGLTLFAPLPASLSEHSDTPFAREAGRLMPTSAVSNGRGPGTSPG